jgi:hypothetical protein
MPESSGYLIEIAGQSVDRAAMLNDKQDARHFVARGQ